MIGINWESYTWDIYRSPATMRCFFLFSFIIICSVICSILIFIYDIHWHEMQSIPMTNHQAIIYCNVSFHFYLFYYVVVIECVAVTWHNTTISNTRACVKFGGQVLVAKSTDNLNNLNNEGYTPLHLSCQWDKPDCVKALLAAGADANIQSAKTKGSQNSKNTFFLFISCIRDKYQ